MQWKSTSKESINIEHFHLFLHKRVWFVFVPFFRLQPPPRICIVYRNNGTISPVSVLVFLSPLLFRSSSLRAGTLFLLIASLNSFLCQREGRRRRKRERARKGGRSNGYTRSKRYARKRDLRICILSASSVSATPNSLLLLPFLI